MIIEKILPVLSPHLLYDDKSKWLAEDRYLLPSLAEIHRKQQAEDLELTKRRGRLSTISLISNMGRRHQSGTGYS
jgi:hypothetical protein